MLIAHKWYGLTQSVRKVLKKGKQRIILELFLITSVIFSVFYPALFLDAEKIENPYREYDVKNEEKNNLWWMKKDIETKTLTNELLSDEKQSWIFVDQQIQEALRQKKYSHLNDVYCNSYINPFTNTLYIVLTDTSSEITGQFLKIGELTRKKIVIQSKIPIGNTTQYIVKEIIREEKLDPVTIKFVQGKTNYDSLKKMRKLIIDKKDQFKNNNIDLIGISITENGTLCLQINDTNENNIKKIGEIIGNKISPELISIRKGVYMTQTSFANRQQEHDVLIGGLRISISDGSDEPDGTLGFFARNLNQDEIGIFTAGHLAPSGVGDDVYQPLSMVNNVKIGDVDEIFDSTVDAMWIELDNRKGIAKIYNNTSTQILVDEHARLYTSIRIGQPVWWNGAASQAENIGWVEDANWYWSDFDINVVYCSCNIGDVPIGGDSGAPVYRKRYDTYADVWRAEPMGIVNGGAINRWVFSSLDLVEDESGDNFDYRLDRDLTEFSVQGSGSFSYSDFNQDNHITTLYCNEDAWSYEDKTSGFFDEWYAELTVDADSHGTQSGGAFLFALSDEINDWQDIDDGIGLYLTWAKGAGEWRLVLKTRQNGDTTDSDYYTPDTALKRVTIEKDGTDIYAYIYDNVNRTMYEDTLHVTMDSDQSYRYVFSVMSNDSGKSQAYFTGDVTEFAYWTKDNK